MVQQLGATHNPGWTWNRRRIMKVYKIMHKTKPHFLLASGFYGIERAEAWIADFNPKIWDDKTLRAEDLVILEET